MEPGEGGDEVGSNHLELDADQGPVNVDRGRLLEAAKEGLQSELLHADR